MGFGLDVGRHHQAGSRGVDRQHGPGEEGREGQARPRHPLDEQEPHRPPPDRSGEHRPDHPEDGIERRSIHHGGEESDERDPLHRHEPEEQPGERPAHAGEPTDVGLVPDLLVEPLHRPPEAARREQRDQQPDVPRGGADLFGIRRRGQPGTRGTLRDLVGHRTQPGDGLDPIHPRVGQGLREEGSKHDGHRDEGQQRLRTDRHGAVDDLDPHQVVDAPARRGDRVEDAVEERPEACDQRPLARDLPGPPPLRRVLGGCPHLDHGSHGATADAVTITLSG